MLAGKFYQGYHCSSFILFYKFKIICLDCNQDMHFDCCGLQRCTTTNNRIIPGKNGHRARSNSSVNFYSVCQCKINKKK